MGSQTSSLPNLPKVHDLPSITPSPKLTKRSSKQPNTPSPSSSSPSPLPSLSPSPPLHLPKLYNPQIQAQAQAQVQVIPTKPPTRHLSLDERCRLRGTSIKYIKDHVYYGVPIKIKGVGYGYVDSDSDSESNNANNNANVNDNDSNTLYSPQSNLLSSLTTSDPKQIIISLDYDKINDDLKAFNNSGNTDVKIDMEKEYGGYPAWCKVGRDGDVFVSYRDRDGGERGDRGGENGGGDDKGFSNDDETEDSRSTSTSTSSHRSSPPPPSSPSRKSSPSKPQVKVKRTSTSTINTNTNTNQSPAHTNHRKIKAQHIRDSKAVPTRPLTGPYLYEKIASNDSVKIGWIGAFNGVDESMVDGYWLEYKVVGDDEVIDDDVLNEDGKEDNRDESKQTPPSASAYSPNPWIKLQFKPWSPSSNPHITLQKPLPQPNKTYVFRYSCRNHIGSSLFSPASKKIKTLCTVPCRCSKMYSGRASSVGFVVGWGRGDGNGGLVNGYQVRCKVVETSGSVSASTSASASDGFVLIYEGRELSYYFTPDTVTTSSSSSTSSAGNGTTFIFNVRCRNYIGYGEWSQNYVVTSLPPRDRSESKPKTKKADSKPKVENEEEEGKAIPDDMKRGELWLELWDSITSSTFYFHKLLGVRQLTVPMEYAQHKLSLSKDAETASSSDDSTLSRVKRYKFLKSLREVNGCDGNNSSSGNISFLTLNIKRSNLFSDTLVHFRKLSKTDLTLPPKIIYAGEAGIDSGGLTKDWYMCLSRSLSVDVHRIMKVTTHGTLEIHPQSQCDKDTLEKFTFAGKVLGKALFDRQFIDLPLTKAMYKLILGLEVEVELVEEVDSVLWKSLLWMKNNDVTGVLFETFSVEVPVQGAGNAGSGSGKAVVMEQVALCENGENIEVTEANKHEYIKLMGMWRIQYATVTQLDAFMQGLNTLVPQSLLKGFSVGELELLFNGKKNVDVDEIRAYTIYQGGESWDKEDSNEVQWFWSFLRECDMVKRTKVLKFITGSDRVPLDGFNPPFNVTEGSDMGEGSLPRSHSCFNQLVIPPYKSYGELKERVWYAVENCEDFGMS